MFIFKYRKGSIRTIVEIKPPQKILKNVIKKMVKIIPPLFITLKLQGGNLNFYIKKLFQDKYLVKFSGRNITTSKKCLQLTLWV